MKNSLTLELFRKLEPGEWQDFQLYVQSGLSRVSLSTKKLLKTLASYYPNFETKNMDAEHIFSNAFPNRNFHPSLFRKEMMYLYQVAKDFLSFLELSEQEERKTLFILHQFRKRELRNGFKKTAKRFRTELGAIKDEAEALLYERELNQAEAELGGIERKDDPHDFLSRRSSVFDQFFFLEKLRDSCEMLNRAEIINKDYQYFFLEEVIKFLGMNWDYVKSIPAIHAYFLTYHMLKEEHSAARFHGLVSLLEKQGDLISEDNLRALYQYAQNYCIRKINAGDQEFLVHIFSLYQRQLDNGLLYLEGEISHSSYKNIVTVGLRLKYFEWTELFMESQTAKVNIVHRDNVYQFSLASLHEAKGEKDLAIQVLQNVHFSDPYYAISGRHLLLRIFLEKRDHEAASYQVESFLLFLKRNKQISLRNKENHLSYLTFQKRILSLWEKSIYLEKEEIAKRCEKIRSKIRSTAQIAYKDRLLEQLTTIQQASL